jgi:ABC-type dipeptide/oligopeptide/nickel transport system permease subunit
MATRWTRLKRLRRHPLLTVGLALVAVLIGISIYAVIAIPYTEAITLWRGGPGVWDDNPRNARPVCADWFTRDRLPRTIIVTSEDGAMTAEPVGAGMSRVEIVLPFRYEYNGFPTQLTLRSTVTSGEARTLVSIYWEKPDGETITLQEDRPMRPSDTYYISQDSALHAQLGTLPHLGLLADCQDGDSELKGDYQVVVQAELPQDARLETTLLVYGQVHGMAGTDHRGRDLTVALLWGAPMALLSGIQPAAAIMALAAVFLLIRRARRSDAARAHRSMRAVLLPLFFLVAAAFVLLRALLDVLGLGDPIVPTWGKMIHDALMNQAPSTGLYYWIWQPAVLLIMTGLGFTMTGDALHRILKPRPKAAQ